MANEIKKSITAWTSPPNSPATIRRKTNKKGQKGKVLIDTGHMRLATTFKVRPISGGETGGAA